MGFKTNAKWIRCGSSRLVPEFTKKHLLDVNMSERRPWPLLLYLSLIVFIGLTLWHITSEPLLEIDPSALYIVHTSNISYAHPLHLLPSDDFQRLIDMDNFTFTISNQPCHETDPLLLVLIHTAPKNHKNRQLLRSTWAKSTPKVKILFVVGLTENQELSHRLQAENLEYGDMIQGNFLDSYRNMTYKHVMVLKYAIYFCPRVKYVLKTDDDVFVNMPLMAEFLTSLSPFGASRMLFCQVIKNSMVQRSWRSKWRVSFKEYSDRFYPTYCPGFVILYSPDSVFKLYQAAQNATYFWIDDVWITGTLAERVGLNHVDIKDLRIYKSDYRSIERGLPINRSFVFSWADPEPHQIETMWRYVSNHETPLAALEFSRLV